MTDAAPVEVAPAKAARPPTRHEWYQTDSDVVLSIFIRNVDPATLKVEFEDRSFTVSFPLPTGAEFSWGVDPLSHAIVPAQSTFRVLAPKIELTLKKKDAAVRWGKLEGEDVGPVDTMVQPTASSAAHSYPSSSKKHTNWDALAKAAAEEEENTKTTGAKDPNAGGDKQLNELFQKLYEGATEDQRKAMIKSYQESNGTALSTDWGEVSKGKVETKPPDSMIAKQWGK